jgi:hypothetical protein
LAAAGIPTVNGVLYYPQRLFWDRLGLASEDWPTVNRYQHLGVELGFLPADSSTFQVKSNQIDSVDLILDPLRFDFTTTGAYRVVALEKDAKLLRLSPYLKEQGQYNGLFWFSVQNK